MNYGDNITKVELIVRKMNLAAHIDWVNGGVDVTARGELIGIEEIPIAFFIGGKDQKFKITIEPVIRNEIKIR